MTYFTGKKRGEELPLKGSRTWQQSEGSALRASLGGLSGDLFSWEPVGQPGPQPSQCCQHLHGSSVGSCGVKDRAGVGVVS